MFQLRAGFFQVLTYNVVKRGRKEVNGRLVYAKAGYSQHALHSIKTKTLALNPSPKGFGPKCHIKKYYFELRVNQSGLLVISKETRLLSG